MQGGLYEVVPGLYQARTADLSNITFAEGDEGVVVFDPLLSQETAAAALALYYEHRPRWPIVAVVHSHSHVDHYGGIRGVVDEDDVRSGKVRIIAPVGFLEAAIAESVLAGNAMGRRATYMYGNLLPCSSGRARPTRTASTAGSRRSSTTWGSPIPTTRRRAGCRRRRSSSSATNRSPARGATPELLWDFLAVTLNGVKAGARRITINVTFPDLGQSYCLMVRNGALSHRAGREDGADVSFMIDRQDLDKVLLGEASVPELLASGSAGPDGDATALQELFGLLDSFEFWFNIVTP